MHAVLRFSVTQKNGSRKEAYTATAITIHLWSFRLSLGQSGGRSGSLQEVVTMKAFTDTHYTIPAGRQKGLGYELGAQLTSIF